MSQSLGRGEDEEQGGAVELAKDIGHWVGRSLRATLARASEELGEEPFPPTMEAAVKSTQARINRSRHR